MNPWVSTSFWGVCCTQSCMSCVCWWGELDSQQHSTECSSTTCQVLRLVLRCSINLLSFRATETNVCEDHSFSTVPRLSIQHGQDWTDLLAVKWHLFTDRPGSRLLLFISVHTTTHPGVWLTSPLTSSRSRPLPSPLLLPLIRLLCFLSSALVVAPRLVYFWKFSLSCQCGPC